MQGLKEDHGDLESALITRGRWSPNSAEFAAYKGREVEMAVANLQRPGATVSAMLHSQHTILLAQASLRARSGEGRPSVGMK